MVKFFMDNGQEILVSTSMSPEQIDRYYSGLVREQDGFYEKDSLSVMIFGEARIPRNKIQSYFILEHKEMWDYDDPLN